MANPALITASRNVSHPVLTVPASPFVSDCLEGVVDGDGEPGMRLLSEALHGQGHPVEKECFSFLLASVAIGRGHQLFGFRHGERGEKVGEN